MFGLETLVDLSDTLHPLLLAVFDGCIEADTECAFIITQFKLLNRLEVYRCLEISRVNRQEIVLIPLIFVNFELVEI